MLWLMFMEDIQARKHSEFTPVWNRHLSLDDDVWKSKQTPI